MRTVYFLVEQVGILPFQQDGTSDASPCGVYATLRRSA